VRYLSPGPSSQGRRHHLLRRDRFGAVLRQCVFKFEARAAPHEQWRPRIRALRKIGGFRSAIEGTPAQRQRKEAGFSDLAVFADHAPQRHVPVQPTTNSICFNRDLDFAVRDHALQTPYLRPEVGRTAAVQCFAEGEFDRLRCDGFNAGSGRLPFRSVRSPTCIKHRRKTGGLQFVGSRPPRYGSVDQCQAARDSDIPLPNRGPATAATRFRREILRERQGLAGREITLDDDEIDRANGRGAGEPGTFGAIRPYRIVWALGTPCKRPNLSISGAGTSVLGRTRACAALSP